MAGHDTTAERYRNRAEELRVIAASAIDRNTKRILNEVAGEYDAMAEKLDGDGAQRGGDGSKG